MGVRTPSREETYRLYGSRQLCGVFKFHCVLRKRTFAAKATFRLQVVLVEFGVELCVQPRPVPMLTRLA